LDREEFPWDGKSIGESALGRKGASIERYVQTVLCVIRLKEKCTTGRCFPRGKSFKNYKERGI